MDAHGWRWHALISLVQAGSMVWRTATAAAGGAAAATDEHYSPTIFQPDLQYQ